MESIILDRALANEQRALQSYQEHQGCSLEDAKLNLAKCDYCDIQICSSVLSAYRHMPLMEAGYEFMVVINPDLSEIQKLTASFPEWGSATLAVGLREPDLRDVTG